MILSIELKIWECDLSVLDIYTEFRNFSLHRTFGSFPISDSVHEKITIEILRWLCIADPKKTSLLITKITVLNSILLELQFAFEMDSTIVSLLTQKRLEWFEGLVNCRLINKWFSLTPKPLNLPNRESLLPINLLFHSFGYHISHKICIGRFEYSNYIGTFATFS